MRGRLLLHMMEEEREQPVFSLYCMLHIQEVDLFVGWGVGGVPSKLLCVFAVVWPGELHHFKLFVRFVTLVKLWMH